MSVIANARVLALSSSLALTVACGGETQSANGEFGMITYSLHSDYLMDGEPLDETTILTSHIQQFNGTLIDSSSDALETGVETRVIPSEGVTIADPTTEAPLNYWSFDVTVTNPGAYTFETWSDGEMIDRIEVTFEAPDALDLIGWARGPWEEGFEPIYDNDTLEVGTQVAFLPVPLNTERERIAGDMFAEISVNDESLAVPDSEILAVQEQGVYTIQSTSSLYLIAEGEVEVTLTDVPNAVAATWSFDVTGTE